MCVCVCVQANLHVHMNAQFICKRIALNSVHVHSYIIFTTGIQFSFPQIYNLWTVMDCLSEQESLCVSCVYVFARCTFT